MVVEGHDWELLEERVAELGHQATGSKDASTWPHPSVPVDFGLSHKLTSLYFWTANPRHFMWVGGIPLGCWLMWTSKAIVLTDSYGTVGVSPYKKGSRLCWTSSRRVRLLNGAEIRDKIRQEPDVLSVLREICCDTVLCLSTVGGVWATSDCWYKFVWYEKHWIKKHLDHCGFF